MLDSVTVDVISVPILVNTSDKLGISLAYSKTLGTFELSAIPTVPYESILRFPNLALPSKLIPERYDSPLAPKLVTPAANAGLPLNPFKYAVTASLEFLTAITLDKTNPPNIEVLPLNV